MAKTTKRGMVKPKAFKTINPAIAQDIFRLHDEHPNLGHDGLLKLLREDLGHEVDTRELTLFLDEHEIHGEVFVRTWGGLIAPSTGGAAGVAALGH